jgi:hypothetical protein
MIITKVKQNLRDRCRENGGGKYTKKPERGEHIPAFSISGLH